MFMMKLKKSRKLKKSKDNTLVSSCNFGEKYQVAGLMSFNYLNFP